VVPLAKVTGVTMQSSDTFRPVAFRTRVGVPGNIIALAEFDERQMGGRLTLPLNLRAALSAAVGFPLGQDIPLSADWEDVPLSRLGRPQAEFLRHYQVGWNGDFYFERGRFSVRAELPLMKNAVAAGGELAGITGMATRDYHVFLNLVVLNPTGLYASLLPRDPATPAPLSIYLLVNRARREAIYLDDSSHLSALAAGSVMSTSNLFFYANLYHHPGTPQAKTFTAQETRDWLAGARLLVLGYEPVDFVSTTAILDQPAPGK
jgi:hypothetical protein